MSAQHIAAAAIVVDIAREKAIREALDGVIRAVEKLAKTAGADFMSISLGRCDEVHAVATRSEWRSHVQPYSAKPGVGFAFATLRGPIVSADVYGPDMPVEVALTPAADANPIVIRPLGLGA